MPNLAQETRSRIRSALVAESATSEVITLFEQIASSLGSAFYVDSVLGSSSNRGTEADTALATIEQAVAKCTASKGDVIYVLPGHVEDVAAGENIDIDVAGVSVIGFGSGPDRPRIDFNGTTATMRVLAAGCTIRNITLRPSVALVAEGLGVDGSAGATDTLLQDIEFLPGEEGDGTDEFVVGIAIKTGATRTTIRGLRYSHHASCDGSEAAVRMTLATDRILIEDFWIEGSGAAWVAGIEGKSAAMTRIRIKDGLITCDAEPGIQMVTGTTGSIEDINIFSNLATIDAATVADGCAHFNVLYCETGNEAGTLVKTPSIDD